MIFVPTPLAGAYIIDVTPIEDERGYFVCTWAADELAGIGLDPAVVQCNAAWNARKGTLRGMHFQHEPCAEVKIVRCTRGALLDVIIDLRKDSPTYCQWTAAELTVDNHRALYIPKGFAHGYQTLTDDVEAYYHLSTPYSVAHVGGVRWNDPVFGIRWPLEPTAMIKRDREWPDFRP